MTTRRVKFLTSIAGPRFAYNEGFVYEMPADAAVRWVRRGLAQWADRTGGETADTGPAEVAALRIGRPKPRKLGGGWYELPGGEKVRGRQALERALAAG